MRVHFITALLAIALLSGCTTKYQPYSYWGGGGYIDKKISEDAYNISFVVARLTSAEMRKKMLLYRSAEIAIAANADYFEVMKSSFTYDNNMANGFVREDYTIRIYRDKPKELLEGMYEAKKVISDYKSTVLN